MDEKRKAIRVKSTLFVQYACNDAAGNKLWDISTVKDISETGICLQTGRNFELNSLIFLRLIIPSRPFDKTEVQGKIVGCSKTEQSNTWLTRVEFNDIEDDTKIILHEYVNWVFDHLKTDSSQ